jgi:hypothetical protein
VLIYSLHSYIGTREHYLIGLKNRFAKIYSFLCVGLYVVIALFPIKT